MVDKLRRTFPIQITFADGEQPTAIKINAISTQARNGLGTIEYAVGDPWGQSGDDVFTDLPLNIPSLARQMGANVYLNPVIPPTIEDFVFYENIGERHLGKTAGHLVFKPKAALSISIIAGTAISGAPQTNEYDVDTAGEWWVDEDTGKFRTFTPLDGTEIVAYAVSPADDWIAGEETEPGIIPDPGQSTFTSCRVSTAGGLYYLHLPPRQPLTLSTRESPENYPLATELTSNKSSSAGAPYKLWQDAVTALTGAGSAHYRYHWPKEIQDALDGGSLAAGDEIPRGFMYLWDDTSEELITDVIFKVPSVATDAFVLEVSSETYDLSAIVTSDETEASYTGTNLVLVTCGTPLSRKIWTLSNEFYQHKHNGQDGALDAPISHSDLDNNNPPTFDYAGHATRYPTHLSSWPSSRWSFDDHTSLLSRAGSWTTVSGVKRDDYNNAMLGDLLLANQDTTGASNYLDATLPLDSYSIIFGDVGGLRIYGSGAGATLVVSGYNNGDTKLKIIPQASDPAGPNEVGDLYMKTPSTLMVCTVAGSPGTWAAV